MRKKVLAFGLALCLVLAMSGEVFAGSPGFMKKANTNLKEGKVIGEASIKNLKNKADSVKAGSVKLGVVRDSYGDLAIYSPGSNSVFYKGESIPVRFTAADSFGQDGDVYWWTGPYVVLTFTPTNRTYYAYDYEAVDQDSVDSYAETIKIANNYPVGRYAFTVTLYPYSTYYYSDDNLPGNLDEIEDDLPYAELYLTIKNLNAPTGLKATAGKKKVTVTFRGAEGASRYQIFRSLKKNTGYKLVKTTTARKFVDKKVKKGKRYFYKVRTVRSVRGTIISGFSGTVRSKKVKK